MTTAYALIAPLRLGEDCKRLVRTMGIGRSDLKIGRRDNLILIPLRHPIPPPYPDTYVEVAEFVSTKPPKTYKDVVQIPEKYREQLPTSFDIVGDLVLIKIPDAIRVYGPAIAEAILKVHKNVKGVFHDDGVQGPMRLRNLKNLGGENRTRTRHTEFGNELWVDLAKAYFSPRLANEHERVAKLVQVNEVVVDATAGVGPFAVPIARQRRASKVVAIDLNPDAVALLKENVAMHRLEDRVEVIEGDAVQAVPNVPAFERAVVNLPHGGEEILLACARRAKPGARLHYYRIVAEPERDNFTQTLTARLQAETGRAVALADRHVVHPYSPVDRLYAFDFQVA